MVNKMMTKIAMRLIDKKLLSSFFADGSMWKSFVILEYKTMFKYLIIIVF